ncbi:MAG: ribosomal protein S18-alanine N-acetyltransferase [Candidatus Hydrothermarchaeota archaeon]
MTNEDLARVKEIEKLSFPEPWSSYALEYMVSKYPHGCWVAVLDNEVVGYSIHVLEYRDRAHLLKLAVDPAWRRKGIATTLVLHIIEELKSLNVRSLKLEVRESNLAARILYKSLGFVETRKIPRYYLNGENAVIMVKRL